MVTKTEQELVIKGVSRTFPGVHGGKPTLALQATDLIIPKNDFVTILGPSGCGKSTLLRIIAGLDKPSTGTVTLEGQPVKGPGADRGMVFQSYTLFPWLTIRQNVGFGLREKGVPEKQAREIVDNRLILPGTREGGAGIAQPVNGILQRLNDLRLVGRLLVGFGLFQLLLELVF